MITKRIIPCLDVRGGRVVKGTNFEGIKDVADPVEMARLYNAAGADELVFYDITASFEGRALFTDILTRVAGEIFIPLTVGGGINTLEDFYAAIGYGGVLLSRLMPRVKEEFQKTYRSAAEEEKKAALLPQQTAAAGKKPGKPTSGVIVEGLDSCLVKFAKCCNPLPGDPIVGFITRGYGVSIHKQDCVNVINSPAENEGRWVRAEWASNVTSEKFKSTIDITSQPRDTLLADVTILLSNMHIPMHALVAKESKDHSVILIQVTVEVNGVDQLSYLLNSLRAIKGVEDVRRTIQ